MAVIEAIATTYLEADAASVTFSSLGSYEHLQLRISAKSTDWFHQRRCSVVDFNGDTGSNYSYHHMMGTDGQPLRCWRVRKSNGSSALPNASKQSEANYGPHDRIDILDYRNANKNTTFSGKRGTAHPLHLRMCVFQSGVWDNTAAVTSIVVVPVRGFELDPWF